MFLITASYPLPEYCPAKEQEITSRAGRTHDRSETTPTTRVRVWCTETFEAAVALRTRLALAPGVRATLREE